jgi:hypothetical protein
VQTINYVDNKYFYGPPLPITYIPHRIRGLQLFRKLVLTVNLLNLIKVDP